jgi:hypothetical protein
MSVDELRGLVGKEADESTSERREPIDARSSKACRQRNEIAASVAARTNVEAEIADDVVNVEAAFIQDDDGGRIPSDERVPAPPLGTLHTLEQDTGPVTRECREDSDRRRDVGEQLCPHRRERARRCEGVERFSVGEHLQRSLTSCRAAPETVNPGTSPGALV